MSKADGFRQFADEALRWAKQSKTKKEQLALIDLASRWTEAAARLDFTPSDHSPNPERVPANSIAGSP
jgi:hypothetical protein